MPKVSLSLYAGREQAFVKHCLLEEYLPDWAYKVGSKWDSLVYVDAFAGPWGVVSPELQDSSFDVAVDAIQKAVAGHLVNSGRALRARSILVEKGAKAFAALSSYAENRKRRGHDVHALKGEFKDLIPDIQKLVADSGTNPFKFVFLDPKGWADIPMTSVAPLLKGRSCEVLINVMTRHITRFLEEDDRAESYNAYFGREGVLEKLQQTPTMGGERAEQSVREYCRSLKKLCDFKYVSSAVILEPNVEAVRYFLVFATNHSRGVEVFKAAEMKAARTQDMVRKDARERKNHQSELELGAEVSKTAIVQELRAKYVERARRKMFEMLQAGAAIWYRDLFCEVMAFPMVTPADLVAWLEELSPSVDIQLAAGKRRMPSPAAADVVHVVDGADILLRASRG